MKYAEITTCEICNGLGVGISLFVQGCNIRCDGCFNKYTWDFLSGEEFTDETMRNFIGFAAHSYIDRISILGGEPLCDENVGDIKSLLDTLRHHRDTRDKQIWIYTGHTINQLSDEAKVALRYADVLVEGPYIKEQRDITLAFRGSRNQRIIDLNATTDWNNPVVLNLDA